MRHFILRERYTPRFRFSPYQLGRRLMALYNRKGIFGNKTDSMDALAAMLRRHFADVNVRQQGKVALFTAASPVKREREV